MKRFLIAMVIGTSLTEVLVLRWSRGAPKPDGRSLSNPRVKVGLMLVITAVTLAPVAAVAAPSDDIRGYCAGVHQSYQYRLICEREEQAAKARLYRLEGMPYGIPPEIWAYCGRVHSAWQYMEICTKEELRAKGMLGVR